MKRIIIVLFIILGNMHRTMEASVISKTVGFGALFLPTVLLEGIHMRLAYTDMKDIKDNLDIVHSITPGISLDTTPYGKKAVFVANYLKNKPDLYEAIKTHEEGHITYSHLPKRRLLAEISPFFYHVATSPLAKMPYRIARATRPLITFGLWIGSVTALMRQQEKEADLFIKNPDHLKAWMQCLDYIKEAHPKTRWFDTHPCSTDRINYMNDHLTKMQSEKS